MMNDSIRGLHMEYVGKTVLYGGKTYKVVDTGQDGELLIDRPTRDSETTAVSTAMCQLVDRNKS